MSVRFEPKWPEDPNEDGFYMPEDEDARTLPPDTARTEVYDIISRTYLPKQVANQQTCEVHVVP